MTESSHGGIRRALAPPRRGERAAAFSVARAESGRAPTRASAPETLEIQYHLAVDDHERNTPSRGVGKLSSSVTKDVVGDNWEMLALSEGEEEVIGLRASGSLEDLAGLLERVELLRVIDLVSQRCICDEDRIVAQVDEGSAHSGEIFDAASIAGSVMIGEC